MVSRKLVDGITGALVLICVILVGCSCTALGVYKGNAIDLLIGVVSLTTAVAYIIHCIREWIDPNRLNREFDPRNFVLSENPKR